MKIVLLTLLSIGLFLSSCNSDSDKITGSSSLSDQIAGKYTRSSKEDFGTYTNSIKDTIDIAKKDEKFEVQNRRWFMSSNDTADGYSQTQGFGTFQSTYNKADSSLANPLGGSIKFDRINQSIYLSETPSITYAKVK